MMQPITTSELGAAHRAEEPAATATPSVARQYATISLFVVPTMAYIVHVALREARPIAEPRVLLGPVFAVLALTAIVWLLMLVARNLAVMLGAAPVAFFRNFDGAAIPDWVERPARTFNNLMQVPLVFYAVCALMIGAGEVDSVQLTLAWIFAGSRYLHAFAFVGWNDVKWRFAMALPGFVTMGILAARFGMQTAHLWLPG
ncbi:MAG: MAPEG family protein [Myxococcales bacterium]|nr:MAPEG family protein [Myxococcales bacterium]